MFPFPSELVYALEPVTTGLIIGSLVSAAIGAASNAWNSYQTGKTNRENQEWTEEQNAKTRELEAHALQIRTQDAVNAGFSPLAALQTGAAQVSTPMQYQAQAKQMDLSSLIGSVTSLTGSFADSETSKKIAELQSKTTEKGYLKDLEIARLQAQSAQDIANANIKSAEKMASEEHNLQWIKMNQDYSIAQANTQNVLSSLELETSKANADNFMKLQDENIKSWTEYLRPLGIRYRFVSMPTNTEEERKAYSQMWSNAERKVNTYFQNFSDWYNSATPEQRAEYWSKSKTTGTNNTWSGQLGATVPKGVTGVGTIGGSVGGSHVSGETSGESVTSKMRSDVQRFQQWQFQKKQIVTIPVTRPVVSSGSNKYSFYQTPSSYK